MVLQSTFTTLNQFVCGDVETGTMLGRCIVRLIKCDRHGYCAFDESDNMCLALTMFFEIGQGGGAVVIVLLRCI